MLVVHWQCFTALARVSGTEVLTIHFSRTTCQPTTSWMPRYGVPRPSARCCCSPTPAIHSALFSQGIPPPRALSEPA